MTFGEASAKNRNVPNAADAGENVSTAKNRMGHPEQTVTHDGEKEQTLNELNPESDEEIMDNFDLTARRNLGGGRRGRYEAAGLSQVGDENLPDSHNESRGSSMTKIDETVQDQKGVSGDFMDKMGGKTDQLGASQKNTGGAYEKHSESSSGSPDDGVQTALGKGDLIGAKQKNTGGSPEEFGDSGTADAKDGVQDTHKDMAGDLGQNEKQKNKGGSPEPLEGSKNKMSEDWSVDNVANIMEEDDINVQRLFDSYAREATPITLEEFEVLARAHGCMSPLDEETIQALMETNQEFVFYENEDDSGRFWVAGPITESEPFPGAAPPFGSEGNKGDDEGDDKGDGGGEAKDDDNAGDKESDKPFPGAAPPFKSKEKDEPIEERRFGGAEEAAFDPFGVDLDRTMRDPGHEYPELEPEVGPPVGLADEIDELGFDEPGLGEPGLGEPGLGEPGLGEPGLGEPGLGGLDRSRAGALAKSTAPVRIPQAQAPITPPLGPDMGGAGVGYEARKTQGQTITEMTGTSGIAAPPMGTAISRGTAAKREEPVVDVETEKEKEKSDFVPLEGFQQCARCGGLLDQQGCPTCALLHETHEFGVDAPEPSTDAGGHFTSDATKSGLGDVGGSVKGALTNDSGSTKADDGITTELSGMGSALGQNEKVKNKGAQHEPLKGGGGGMQENVTRMAAAAKKSIQESALLLRKNGEFGVQLVVHCEGIKPRQCRNLTEALVNVEELVQVYGPGAVQLEAHFFEGDISLAKKVVRLPAIEKHGPVVSEGRCVFRYAEVANDFADQIVAEGTQCKVNRHNWGASVVGKYSWESAQKAFKNIPAIQEAANRPT